ncbi:MAG: hypothetical protein KDJ99_32280 [Candidatus Competibacteraceae bacterium]|nr:hypothetical protein [Candidatus Competibacteraceae bacterium]
MQTLLLQFLSALVGGFVVYIFGIRRFFLETRNAFIQKQISEFYSPIAGYRKRISAKSEVRLKVSDAANEAWKELCAPYSEANQRIPDHDEQFAPYEKIIDYDNNQLREELMPLYRAMLEIFTEKYWLADAETRAYYQDFLEFVEIWERYLAEALPPDVIRKLEHTEENVKPFYEHIETKLTNLQEEITSTSFLTQVKNFGRDVKRQLV